MDFQPLIPIVYLVAAVTFILGLKGLSGPRTAVNGNRIAAAGMLLAVAVTFFDQTFRSYGATGLLITIAGMVVGGGAGFYGARVVKMTAMPQMVALFNGAGGGAAALVSILEVARAVSSGTAIEPRIQPRLSRSVPKNVARRAMAAPAAPTRLPRRAERGLDRPLSARMKQTAAAR